MQRNVETLELVVKVSRLVQAQIAGANRRAGGRSVSPTSSEWVVQSGRSGEGDDALLPLEM